MSVDAFSKFDKNGQLWPPVTSDDLEGQSHIIAYSTIWPSVTFDDLEGQIQIMAYNIIWTLNFPTSHRWSVYLS